MPGCQSCGHFGVPLLGGPWDLVIIYNWTDNPTCNFPKWAYGGYQVRLHSQLYLVTKSHGPPSTGRTIMGTPKMDNQFDNLPYP